MATGALVIAICSSPASGAVNPVLPTASAPVQTASGGVSAPSGASGAQDLAVRVAEAACPTARQAVRFYGVRVDYWRSKMGAGAKDLGHAQTGKACPRYLAHVLQRKAYGLRRYYERWHAYQYDWSSWLPDKWQRIGACETGYGRRPGNWRHSNSSYEGAFGFAKSSWDQFKYRADRKAGPYPADAWQATPRQQYEVALAIWRRYGFSGWGCRGA